MIFPARAKKGSGAYILPGYSSTSKEIVLDNPHRDVEVKLGDELRIWYGEDFFSFADSDNSGKACVDVYADIGNILLGYHTILSYFFHLRFCTHRTSQVEAIAFCTTTWAGITGLLVEHLTLNRTLCGTLKLTKPGQAPAT